jgi:hypothetical protein
MRSCSLVYPYHRCLFELVLLRLHMYFQYHDMNCHMLTGWGPKQYDMCMYSLNMIHMSLRHLVIVAIC